MSVEYKWKFPTLEVTYAVGELANVVSVVHWRLVATEENYMADTYGSVGVGTPTPEAFVSYDDLTEEEVISWVTNALGGEEFVQIMKDSLAAQIATQKAPKSGSMSPPWVTPIVIERPSEPTV